MPTETAQAADLIDPPEQLQRSYRQHGELLVVPAIALEAVEMTKDPDCHLAQFACLVEQDAKLATEVLALANSAAYSSGKQTTSLRQALVRLGLRQCHNLIVSVCVTSMMKKVSMEQEWLREVLWQHSLTTATAAMQINRTFGLGYHGEEFTAGLLHDFGRTLFAVINEKQFLEADPLSFTEDTCLLDRERSIFGADHCEFGAWFARVNKLPKSLVHAIRWHHNPENEQPHQRLTALVSAADHMANHLQLFGESTGYDAGQNTGIKVLNSLVGKHLANDFQEISDHLLIEILSRTETVSCSNKESH